MTPSGVAGGKRMRVSELAAAIRGRRRELRLDQASLARTAGVSRKWIYEFEAGKATAELGLVLRVLDALGLDLTIGKRASRRRSSLLDRVVGKRRRP